MNHGDLTSLMMTNAGGRSRFSVYEGGSRYRRGNVTHPDIDFSQYGTIDTKTMTMPVHGANDIEYEHMTHQLEIIAASILNGHVGIPDEQVAPDRFRVDTYELYDGSLMGVITDLVPPRVPRGMSPIHQLFYAPLGLPDHPYPAGMDALRRIAAALCANGFDYSIITPRQQIRNYRDDSLPAWIHD